MLENLQSKEINEIIQALSKAQGSLRTAKKDKKNAFLKSTYADLSAVWDACRSALSINNLAVAQMTAPIDGTLMMITTLAHSSGQWLRSFMPIITQKTDPQSMGSAITYTKKYSLAAIVGVATAEEDDDGEKAMGDRKKQCQTLKASKAPVQEEPPKKITPIHLQEIETLINGHEDIRERMVCWVKASYEGDSLADIPDLEFKKIKKHCELAISKKYQSQNGQEGKDGQRVVS